MAENATQPQLALSAYNNQALFSDHYLQDILRRQDTWEQAITEARPFLHWLRGLYAAEKAQLPHYNEDQLEDKWFKPIFERLGHIHWEGQAVIPGWKGNIKKPDFVFFPDAAARQTAVTKQNTTHYAQHATTLAEVKQWAVNLSKKTGGQPTFADQNPMYQIDTYLTLTRLEWGILSNGRFWRLVHKSSSRTLETYFEIDLLAALTQPDDTFALAVAAYFWRFFGRAAFQPDGRGAIFLDEALTQSRAYALELEADLRDNAYRALEQLIIGFFSGDHRLDRHNPADRALVYQNSLYLLYRLLFIFYGESRALLPLAHPVYREQYALQTLVTQIDGKRSELSALPATGKFYWNRLQELFRLISGSDPQLNADLDVPRYNGGLFDPARHPFLEAYFVGDRALARAIDYLAVRRLIQAGGHPAYQRVDYRTLDVRQLGSIYEGLLEYKVAVAAEEMVTVSKKGVETWVPLAQKGKAKSYGETRQPGDLYLTTDKGERKATGSYYTPDYIVEYIVENTLGPLVAQTRDRVKEQARRLNGLDEAARRQKSADLFVAEILRLNVLDPAMGSGHFLVEAASYLARALATDAYTTTQIGSFSKNEPILESDLLYWKRRVVEACIYGVDKNPMAVELAKLSLWLKTAAADKPLSFLDHHLQHGDSLIGAWLKDLPTAPANTAKTPISDHQSPLFDESAFTRDINRAVADVMTIERLPTNDIEDVHAKEATWQAVRQKYTGRWRQLADLWVSAWFGNDMTPQEYRALADRLQGRDSLMSDAQAETFLNHPAVTDNDYFHWELAFPEVFFDEYGRSLGDAAGFDAVIGNPPYGMPTNKLSKTFFSRSFISSEGRDDLYKLFSEQAYNLTRENGFLSYIVSNTILSNLLDAKLRKLLLTRAKWIKLLTFEYPVFPDPTVHSCLFLIQKTVPRDDNQLLVWNVANSKNVSQSGRPIRQTKYLDDKYSIIVTTSNPETENLIDKIRRNGQALGELSYIRQCIKTGDDNKFLKMSTSPPEPHWKPVLSGRDTSRYSIVWPRRFLNYGPWLARNWQNPDFFERPKIVIRETSDRITAALDENHFYLLSTLYSVYWREDFNGKENLKYLLALINSLTSQFYMQQLVFNLSSGAFTKARTNHYARLPIPRIQFNTTKNKRSKVLATAKTHYKQNNYPAILAWTDDELAANRNDTIHDLLAFLAAQMIAMNQEKQQKVQAFWDDLYGIADEKTYAALHGKGKQQASLHKAVPAARPYVSATSRSRVTLDAALEWDDVAAFRGFVKQLHKKTGRLSDLLTVYRQHAPAVAALSARLTATDDLIDQVVYKLYGLTNAEIAIVEGSP